MRIARDPAPPLAASSDPVPTGGGRGRLVRRRLARWAAAILVALAVASGRAESAPASATPASRRAFIDVGRARLALVEIPPGTFRMGTDEVIHADDGWKICPTCPSRNDVERPAHQVTISREFWMGRFPVTQGQWQEVMGNNPAHNRSAGPDAPVEQVGWNDVQAFLARLNAAQNRWTARLPTEAEWEYAARAGSNEDAYGPLDSIAWYGGNTTGSTHPVGQKRPNAFGLYDMLGNVWQWCQDWFGPYPDSASVDPQGAPTGDRRVTRGGCFYCAAVHERAARRNRDLVDHASATIGFRIVAVRRSPAAAGGDRK